MCDSFEKILDLQGMPHSDIQLVNNHPSQSIECGLDHLGKLYKYPQRNDHSRTDRSRLDKTDSLCILLPPSLRSQRGTGLLDTSHILNAQIK